MMVSKSKIEWTEATWNPIVGCSIVSPGCTNCYAMQMAARIEAMQNSKRNGFNPPEHYVGTTRKVNGRAIWTGLLVRAPEHVLVEPMHRKKPTTYFVNSMGDLFHEDCPDEWIDRVFAVMALCPQHTFQVLTKRAERMRDYVAVRRGHSRAFTDAVADFCLVGRKALKDQVGASLEAVTTWPLPNVWLGISCERQQEADERIPLLLQTPAAVRFVSAEPLLGPIDLMMLKTGDKVIDAVQGCVGYSIGDGEYEGAQPCAKLDWVIVGGESGPKARPMHPDWARSLRDQCQAAGVAFFFKQWGEHEPMRLVAGDREEPWRRSPSGREVWTFNELRTPRDQWPPVTFARVGKKAAGRDLDGRTYDDMPARAE